MWLAVIMPWFCCGVTLHLVSSVEDITVTNSSFQSSIRAEVVSPEYAETVSGGDVVLGGDCDRLVKLLENQLLHGALLGIAHF